LAREEQRDARETEMPELVPKEQVPGLEIHEDNAVLSQEVLFIQEVAKTTAY